MEVQGGDWPCRIRVSGKSHNDKNRHKETPERREEKDKDLKQHLQEWHRAETEARRKKSG